MNLKQLNTFITLSNIKNYTKTANILNYAQSNITNQIQQLESELNTKLFEQIGKKIYLTEDGEKLIPYAIKMIKLDKEIKDVYDDKNRRKSITIGASESLSIYILPAIIKEYKNECPNVDIYLKILDTQEFASSLNENTIDIAFALDFLNKDSSLKVLYSNNEPLGLFSAPINLLVNKSIIISEDLKDVPLIVTGKGCPYRRIFENKLLSDNIVPNIMLETGSVPVIKESTISGLGICFIPECTVKNELLHNKLIKLNYNISSPIYSQLLIHKDKTISEEIKSFIIMFINYLNKTQ